MPISVDVDVGVMPTGRKTSVGELADRVGIRPANRTVLKKRRTRAARVATLAALREVLEGRPGDVPRREAEDPCGSARNRCEGPPRAARGTSRRSHAA
ncbi:helix-turn-helix domain-containing protein [Streptomyces sp. NPDC001902]